MLVIILVDELIKNSPTFFSNPKHGIVPWSFIPEIIVNEVRKLATFLVSTMFTEREGRLFVVARTLLVN